MFQLKLKRRNWKNLAQTMMNSGRMQCTVPDTATYHRCRPSFLHESPSATHRFPAHRHTSCHSLLYYMPRSDR